MEQPLIRISSEKKALRHELEAVLRRNGCEITASFDRSGAVISVAPRFPDGTASLAPERLMGVERMIGKSQAIEDVKTDIRKAAASVCNVLVTGETGTGKELVAELIQLNSQRREKPFVCINCAAVPESLFESELFGYDRGAFTGAYTAREGKLELADGGTVFFDEIGDMSLYAQAKILRALEGKDIRRLGANRTRQLDFRVIAATSRDLNARVGDETFRADLYFRLNVVSIHLPPLRDRKADILPLIAHFIRGFNKVCARNVEGFSETALGLLLRYAWPGNVRELRNVVEATFVNLSGSDIRWMELPVALQHRFEELKRGLPSERDLLLCTLLSTGWNKSRAAEKLHWSRMTLYRKLAKYQFAEERPPKKPARREQAAKCNIAAVGATKV